LFHDLMRETQPQRRFPTEGADEAATTLRASRPSSRTWGIRAWSGLNRQVNLLGRADEVIE
jgi:hypothetical protein